MLGAVLMDTLNGPLHLVGCGAAAPCWAKRPLAVGLQLVHSVQFRGLAADDLRKQLLPRYTATAQGLCDSRHAPQHSAAELTPLMVPIPPPL